MALDSRTKITEKVIDTHTIGTIRKQLKSILMNQVYIMEALYMILDKEDDLIDKEKDMDDLWENIDNAQETIDDRNEEIKRLKRYVKQLEEMNKAKADIIKKLESE